MIDDSGFENRRRNVKAWAPKDKDAIFAKTCLTSAKKFCLDASCYRLTCEEQSSSKSLYGFAMTKMMTVCDVSALPSAAGELRLALIILDTGGS